jgi:hypothetical protein
MWFRNPLALIGLASLLVPIVIHLLVRAPAQPIVLASLRFVSASPMRALRRRLLNDPALLALRLSILALAVAALADPFLAAGCRTRGWNARLARAVVADARVDTETTARARDLPAAFASTMVSTADLRGGLARAMVWLDAAPPARREIVVVGPLELGTLDDAALREIPTGVGVRFVRTASTTRPAPIDGPAVTARTERGLESRRLRVTLDKGRTLATDVGLDPLPAATIAPTPHGWRAPAFALDVLGPDAARPSLRAAIDAALGVGVPVPVATSTGTISSRNLVVLLDTAGALEPWAPRVEALSLPWMAAVAGAVPRDPDVVAEARGARATTRAALPGPWLTLLNDVDGHPLAAVAASDAALVLLARTDAVSPLTPALVRSLLLARDDTRPFSSAETAPIPDADLTRWTREPGDVDAGAIAPEQVSDRSWLWGAALAAVGLETLVRRRRPRIAADVERGRDRAA